MSADNRPSDSHAGPVPADASLPRPRQLDAERLRRLLQNAPDAIVAELGRAEKLTNLGTVVGGIAHDLNNLLAAIIGNTEIARRDSGRPEIGDSLNEILKAADRAKHLARQMTAYFRPQKFERNSVQPAAVVQEVVKFMQPTMPAGVEVVTDLREDAGWVLADSTQLYRVVFNLCSNALQAMQDRGGRLELRLTHVGAGDPGAPENIGLRPDGYVCLSVIDNGHGMDAPTLRRIFEPYFTTKPPSEGTGLGLAVVQRIVQDHDGSIKVHSRPGEGTAFHVFFPTCAESLSETIAPALLGRGEHILCLDDEAPACSTTAGILEAANYKVTAQTAPLEALDLFRGRPDQFDLVITDLAMPGLTGVDFAYEVLKVSPNKPVLLVSSGLGGWTAEKARRLGIRGLVAKPVKINALLKAAQRGLNGGKNRPTKSVP